MNIKKYITEVRAEMRKVSWPDKQKTLKDSTIVIGASLLTAAFMGGADALFSYVTKMIIAG
ncbi:MAG: preprotein translocase subunit SecE [Candidatus Paceibacterota bacterium]